jgi:hypothetical protein
MDVLLLRPSPRNERFGLGPFFRTEPLGLEYIAAALETRGHHTTIVDLRFLALPAGDGRRRVPALTGNRR